MKVSMMVFGLMLGFVALPSIAALSCTDIHCDVKWKTHMGEIDTTSVCYNLQGQILYQECRNLAEAVFKSRCEKAKRSNNTNWIDIYCTAAEQFSP
jgi:hypothetical protein